MGTPDTIIANNIIENTTNIDGASGINVLNGPGTMTRNNIIRNNTAPNYWAILLEHDKGDEKANYIGEGDPQNVQILNNTITGNTNGIVLQAGTDIVLRGNRLENSGTNYLKAPGVTAVEEVEPPIGDEPSSNTDLSDLTLSTGTQESNADIGVTEIKTVGDKQVAFTFVNEKQIDKALQNTDSSLLAISVESGDAEQVNIKLSSKALQKMIDAKSIQTISVDTKLGTYLLPIQQIDIIKWAAQLNVYLENMQLEIIISRNDSAKQHAESSGFKVLAAIDFTIQVSMADGKMMDIDSFTQYVARAIKTEIPVMEGNLAAVRVSTDSSGSVSYEPVPFSVNGNEVIIYSRTNSTYLLLENHLSFKDTQRHWAKDDIEKMANKRIVQGVAPEEFNPDVPVTRAEFAVLLTRFLGLENTAGLSGKISFEDVPSDAWYRDSLAAAVGSGIVSGYENNAFRPDGTISRQEMALMIYRAIQFAGSKDQEPANQQPIFMDQDKVADWAQEAVNRLTGMKLMEGVSNGSFAPSDVSTRAQSAVMLSRMLPVLSFTR
jgi:parallel beta-helix repeat protein